MRFVPQRPRIDSSAVHLSTSCVPLWRPLFPIKGGPRCPGEGFGSFGQVTPAASSRTQEHSNIHRSRNRVFRTSAARTWINPRIDLLAPQRCVIPYSCFGVYLSVLEF